MKRKGYSKITDKDSDDNLNSLSSLFFQWMNEVVKIGSERTLEQDDFLPLSKENQTRPATEKLQTKWSGEKEICKRDNKRPKLWRSVIKSVSIKEVFIIVSTGLLDSVGRLLQPLFLGFVVSALFSAKEPQKNALLYVCALAMAANYFIKNICMHQYFYRSAVLGVKLCSALKGLVYIKVGLDYVPQTVVKSHFKGRGLSYPYSINFWSIYFPTTNPGTFVFNIPYHIIFSSTYLVYRSFFFCLTILFPKNPGLNQ